MSMGFLIMGCAVFFLAVVGVLVYKIRRDYIQIWLGGYLRQRMSYYRRKKSSKPKHIFLCITDHFEPRFGGVSPEKEKERVDIWAEKYRIFASKFRDSDGRSPQHTWFYPFDEKNDYCLGEVNKLVKEGFGEIEFHLHHFKDNEEQLRQKLDDGLKWFQSYGAMISKEGKTAFGFIHGNFALANSVPANCGVNDELSLLESLGCYADFTFPAFGSVCQPRIVNAHYYPEKRKDIPRSYDRGTAMRAERLRQGSIDASESFLRPSGETNVEQDADSTKIRLIRPRIQSGAVTHNAVALCPSRSCGHQDERELLMFSGPLIFDPKTLRFDDGRIESNFPLTYRRFKNWIKAGVCILGKEDWVFVKLYTHSAREKTREALFSSGTASFYQEITSRAARGEFHLHFVTAREIYNLAKAAEAGTVKEPVDCLDFEIPTPRNRLPGQALDLRRL